MNNIFKNYTSQKWKDKELIIILNHDEMDIDKWNKKASHYQNIVIYQLPQKVTLGECLNYGIERSKHDVIAKFDDDDFYGPYYLEEQMQALKNKDADLIGKKSVYTYIESENALGILHPNNENNYVNSVKGHTFLFKKELFKKVQFTPKNVGEDTQFWRDCLEKGLKLYSTSRYNFTYIRRASGGHTWRKSDEQLLQKLFNVCYTNDYRSIVHKKGF